MPAFCRGDASSAWGCPVLWYVAVRAAAALNAPDAELSTITEDHGAELEACRKAFGGNTYRESQRGLRRAEKALEPLTARNRALWSAVDDLASAHNHLAMTEADIAFEIGKRVGRAGPIPLHPARSVLDQFMDALQSAIGQNALDDGNTTEKGQRAMLDTFRRAIPVARAIALIGNPLDPLNPPADLFIKTVTEELGSEGDDEQDEQDNLIHALTDCQHAVGLALGLILADQMGVQ